EPGGQRIRQSKLCRVSHPGRMAIGPDQYGVGRGDRANDRKLPWPGICGVDPPDTMCPWLPSRDVDIALLTEIEQQRPRIVQQRENPQRAVGGDDVEIGHAPTKQRMAVAEIVANIETGHDAGEPRARVVTD